MKTLLLAAAAVLGAGTAARAHEIGTTRVSVRVEDDRTCRVEIVTDAAALLEKLEASLGRSRPAGTSTAALEAALSSFDATFRSRVSIAFDGAGARPAIAYSIRPGTDGSAKPAASIELTTRVPPKARRLTWSYGWTFASYAVTVRSGASGGAQTQWLEGGEVSAPFTLALPAPISRPEAVRRYLALGFTHIVPHGLDHMLFVLGIYLLCRNARSVLSQVSAFTVAHSITLALNMYGIIALPSRVVEPLIAASIAYVAVENIFLSQVVSRRVALVFAFGLLHGMGFAGALRGLGLPRQEFVTALVSFNLGVEGGQLAVIGAAFLAVGWYCSRCAWYRSRVVIPSSALIAVVAVYWTVERIVG